uniref:Uncharacterized protein n=1 Tax=Rhipicephalus appendiculatus TaxID=34631 RepID=A0A131Y9C4_RHIAP
MARIVESVLERMQPGLFSKRQKLTPYDVHYQNHMYTSNGVQVVGTAYMVLAQMVQWYTIHLVYYQNHVTCHRWSTCGWDAIFGVYMDETPYTRMVFSRWHLQASKPYTSLMLVAHDTTVSLQRPNVRCI